MLDTRLVSQRARIAQLEARLEQSKALTRLEEERQRGQLQPADADWGRHEQQLAVGG